MNREARVGFFILVAIAIFIYLSVNIGAIRLWSNSYNVYYTYFDDISGLERKAVVKISGFNVGWVEEIRLADKDKIMVVMRVSNNHKLYKTAYAAITQDGLLGNKMLEIDPGDSSAGLLSPGSVLRMPGVSKATLSDVLEQAKEIANNVYSVAQSFSRVFSSQSGEEKMSRLLDNAHGASEKIFNASDDLASIIVENKSNINRSVQLLTNSISDIAQSTPRIKSTVFELEDKGTKTLKNIQLASSDAASATKSASEVMDKIRGGEGTIGKLVCDDTLYEKTKEAVENFTELTGKAKSLELTIDGNFYNCWRVKNSRGELMITGKLMEDYFYTVGVSSDNYGKIGKKFEFKTYSDSDSMPIDTLASRQVNNSLATGYETINGYEMAMVSPQISTVTIDRKGFRWSLQICKKIKNFTFRGGAFEDAFGVAVDLDVPLKMQNVKWKTSIQVFDFSGVNQITAEVGRPNVRWTNKVQFFKNIYTCFGIDDMCGKYRAAPFWGMGVSFNDDDLKYLLMFAKGGL